MFYIHAMSGSFKKFIKFYLISLKIVRRISSNISLISFILFRIHFVLYIKTNNAMGNYALDDHRKDNRQYLTLVILAQPYA